MLTVDESTGVFMKTAELELTVVEYYLLPKDMINPSIQGTTVN
jgi:hypothetical protein